MGAEARGSLKRYHLESSPIQSFVNPLTDRDATRGTAKKRPPRVRRVSQFRAGGNEVVWSDRVLSGMSRRFISKKNRIIAGRSGFRIGQVSDVVINLSESTQERSVSV